MTLPGQAAVPFPTPRFFEKRTRAPVSVHQLAAQNAMTKTNSRER